MTTVEQRLDERAVTHEEWAWVESLISEVSRQEKNDVFAKRLFHWDLAARQFRKIEYRRIVLGKPAALDLEFHARCLQGLLTIGHALVVASRQLQAEELARVGVKREEIEAYVEELEQSFREWHHGFSDEQLEKVRKAVFSAKA